MTPAHIRAHLQGYSTRGLLACLEVTVDLVAPIRSGRPVTVRVGLTAPDSTNPATRVRVHRSQHAPADPTPAELDRAVWFALVECLRHEAGECLLHEGRLVFDPHEIPRRWPWA